MPNIDPWMEISSLRSSESTSKTKGTLSLLITTTRHCDIANQAGEVYSLAPLPRDQSEKLFYTRIFDARKTCPNQLREVADKILKKCHDVPLAVITMASLLVGKTQGEWIEVSNSIVFGGKKKNQEVSDTEWILSLSYYDLPPHLKSCLLYLSAYPEDYLIQKDHLIWMWVADSFIVDKRPGIGFFEIGEEYFNELINRTMIQAVESKSNYGIIYACRIHDMVLDLIRVKSQEENFFTILSNNVEITSSTRNTSSTCRVHRLSCQTNTWVEPTHLDITQIRTFISFMGWCDTIDFQKFKLLRVLYSRYWGREVHVENLLHLRYLRVGCNQGITKGIRGLEFLKLLQILDLERFGCHYMEELPSSVGLLTQLICLRVGKARLPNGVIQKLTSLQELRIRRVRDDTTAQFMKDLGNLLELRVLHAGVHISKSILESNLVKTLGKLHKLHHLKVVNDSPYLRANEAHAVVLRRPLQHFIIRNVVFPVLPSCINPSDIPNLTHLELSVSFMEEQSLRILGGLPELRHLELRRLKSTLTVNVHVDDDGFFQKLISLSLPRSTVYFALNEDTTISFTIWDGKDDVDFGSAEKGEECIVRAPAVMPNLQLLRFEVQVDVFVRNKGSCNLLGLQYLPSLQKVKVDFWYRDVDDVEREEAALWHAIEAHPNRPTLETSIDKKYAMESRPADGTEEEEWEWEVGSWTDDEVLAT